MLTAEDLVNNYKIIRSSRKTVGMEIRGEQLIVRAPLHMSAANIERFVQSERSWIERRLVKIAERKEIVSNARILSQTELKELAEKACLVIPERAAFYASKMGVSYNRITIRCQKTRWGSCSSTKNLNFNCLLMLTPPEVIDSVVVHELCHLKEMNHSQRFYAEIYKIFPEYDKYNKWLKENGAAIMARVQR